jgi:hypothetical protein
MKHILWVSAALASSLIQAASAQAGFVVLRPGPADGKDANIWIGVPNTNLGNYEYLTVNEAPFDPSLLQNFGLIEFDLSSLTGSSVVSAKLTLFQEFTDAAGAVFDLFRNTSPWDEHTVTWNTRPSIDSTRVASLQLDFIPSIYRDWDVTAVVQGWVSGLYPNYGLTIARTDASNPLAWFASSDHAVAADRPMLTLEISDAPPPDPAPASTPAPSGLILAVTGMAVLVAWRRWAGVEGQSACSPAPRELGLGKRPLLLA